MVLVPLRSFPDDLIDAVELALERELGVEARKELAPLPEEEPDLCAALGGSAL